MTQEHRTTAQANSLRLKGDVGGGVVVAGAGWMR